MHASNPSESTSEDGAADLWQDVGAGLHYLKPHTTTSRGKKRQRRRKNPASPTAPSPEVPLPIPQSDQPPSWALDALLSSRWKICQYIRLFEKTSFTSVHPALLDENNLDYLLGGVWPNPLSLNIAIAVCTGAWIAGDARAENECWMKARQQAAALFDEKDYHIATALAWMFYYLVHKGKREQGTYFAILAMTTLESLQACNCITYLWLIINTFLGAVEEDFNSLQQRMRITEGMPLFCAGLSAPFVQSDVSLPSESSFSDAEDSSDTLDSGAQHILRQLIAINHQAHRNLGNEELILELKNDSLQLWEAWSCVRRTHRLPLRLKIDELFFLNAVMQFWSLGNLEAALRETTEFVRLANLPVYRYLPSLRKLVFYPTQVLAQMQQPALLLQLINVLRDREGGTFLDGPLESFKHLT